MRAQTHLDESWTDASPGDAQQVLSVSRPPPLLLEQRDYMGARVKLRGAPFLSSFLFFLLLKRKCWRTLQSRACVAAQLPCLPPTARGRQSAERSKPKPPGSASLSLKQPLWLCWLHSDQQEPTFDEDAEHNWQSRRLSPANPSLHRFHPAPPTRRPKSTNDARSSQCARRLGRSEPLRASPIGGRPSSRDRERLLTLRGEELTGHYVG